MTTHLHNEIWAFASNWNMTKFYDGLVGPSTRLHGSEEQSWKLMVDNFAAMSRKGSILTRQLACGSHFDLS